MKAVPAFRFAPVVIVLASAAVAGCNGGDADGARGAASAVPERVGDIGGLKVPESIRYDAARDQWFISNINGVPSVKDGNGFIVRANGERTQVDTAFIVSGVNGVTLHAPKGLAIAGDTLWVADIDAVRAFDIATGAPLVTVDLAPMGAVFLNDIAVGPDGALYVTDTGVQILKSGMTHPGPDRVFRIAGGTATEALRFSGGEGPNGITFDHERGHFIIAPFAAQTLYRWTAGNATADSIASGPGGYDGIAVLADGRTLVTSWTDSTLHVLEGGALRSFITGVPSPADIGIDTLRGLVAIPIFEGGRVEFWSIPPQ